jgi:glycine/D-amino acid oxidase-like deaminating enzyme
MRVIVIGAGIIGASIAYHLSARGAKVTVLDRGQPAAGATSKSFSWINAHHADRPDYLALREASIAAHHALEAELGDVLCLRWGGSLAWEADDDALSAVEEARKAQGYPVRFIDAEEFASLEPRVADPPERALHASNEGALDPVAATHALLDAAADNGAKLVLGCEISGFAADGGRIRGVTTAFGQMASDLVVLAVGTAAAPFLEQAGLHLPMDNRDGLIVHTRPVARVLSHLILSPEIHFRQETDGRIVIGEDFTGRTVDEDPVAMAERLMGLLRQRLPDVADLEIGAVMIGTRPEPLDGYPAVGAMRDTDGLYVAAMHSGVTLAPIIGRLAAQEILGEESALLLEPFRPTRFNQ